jgi:hypothetical protein
MKLLHYATASKDSTEAASDSSCDPIGPIFSPESHLVLLFSNRSPFSAGGTDIELDLYKILGDSYSSQVFLYYR